MSAKMADTTYDGLRVLLMGRSEHEARIGHNTVAWLEGFNGTSHVVVKYHATNIAELGMAHDGTAYVVVNSGGYWTSTTKDRLNGFARHLGWTVFQRNFEWFVQYVRSGWEGVDPLPFIDGMTLYEDGRHLLPV